MRRAVIGMLCVAATVGCRPDIERVEIVQITTPPLDHSVSSSEVRLIHGNAVAVTVTVFAEGAAVDSIVSITDQAGMRPIPVSEDDSRFILFAEAPGAGTFTVTSTDTDGSATVNWTVLEQ